MSTELYDSRVTEETFRNGREERIAEYGERNSLAGFRRLRERLVEVIQIMPDTSASEVILDVKRSDLLYVDRRIREFLEYELRNLREQRQLAERYQNSTVESVISIRDSNIRSLDIRIRELEEQINGPQTRELNQFLDQDRLQILIRQRDIQMERLSNTPEGTDRYIIQRGILDGMNVRIAELQNRTAILQEQPVEEEEIITRALREATQEDLSIEERLRRLREYRIQIVDRIDRFVEQGIHHAIAERDMNRIDEEIRRLEEMFRRIQASNIVSGTNNSVIGGDQPNNFLSGTNTGTLIHPQTGRPIMRGSRVHASLIYQSHQELADILRQVNDSPTQSIEKTRLIIRFIRLYREAQSLGSDNYSGHASMMTLVLNERLQQLVQNREELSEWISDSTTFEDIISTLNADLDITSQEIREIEGSQSGPRSNLQVGNIQQVMGRDTHTNMVSTESPVTNLQMGNISQGIGSSSTESPVTNNQDELQKQSYETLIKQLYKLPGADALPEFLIINGLRVSFISYEEITQMLNQNQIERYIIEPLLQPWAGKVGSLDNEPTNRILTMFAKNGMTYLVKAKYDPVNNSINQPI